jgi:hypothetical protein
MKLSQRFNALPVRRNTMLGLGVGYQLELFPNDFRLFALSSLVV